MWLDQTRNLVIYDTPDPTKITSVVPGSKHVANGYVACPNTLHNLQLLRWLGFPVPSPMEGNYDWPGQYTPFNAQRVTANFLAVNPRAFVFNDLGSGKTLSALWAADFLMGGKSTPPAQGPFRALVVAPLSTLNRVWGDAIFRNLLGRRTHLVVYGDARKRREILARPADFYIINYDGVNVIRDALAARPDLRMVIVDEASAYRDFRTRRHKLARQLLGPKDYLWLMTGTPTPNGPTDAYGLAKLVNNAFGESFTSYQSRVMTKVSQFKWVPRAGAHKMANDLMRPSVRFAISDCVDLPPCTTQSRDVELSPDQNKAYKEMKRQLQITVKNGQPITATNEAVLRLKLIQIACGAVYGPDREINHIDAAPRIAALRETMEQCREKIIVFAGLTSVLNLLYKELKDYSREIINGSVSQSKRSDVFRAFENSPNPRVLLADPATMAHGLSLVAATTVIWYAPTDRTELYLQANKRIHRPGQVNATTIVNLVATPVEKEIFRRLEANETMQGLILALAKGEI